MRGYSEAASHWVRARRFFGLAIVAVAATYAVLMVIIAGYVHDGLERTYLGPVWLQAAVLTATVAASCSWVGAGLFEVVLCWRERTRALRLQRDVADA